MYVSRIRRFGDIMLAHQVHKPPQVEHPPLYMLHGVLGNKRNFQTPAKAIAKACNREVVCLDARNHGQSPHMPTMGYHEMAEDVGRLAKTLGHTELSLLGHSMGGRTVMTAALAGLDGIDVEKLVVVDVSTDNSRRSSRGIAGTVSTYIREMARVDMQKLQGLQSTAARGEIEKLLGKHVTDPGVMAFLLTNLESKQKEHRWRANIHALSSQIERIAQFPEFKKGTKYERPTLFIRGSESSYLVERHFADIYRLFPNARIEAVEGSGHWVHADNTKIFVQLVCDFLQD